MNKCSVENCDGALVARSFCNRHYLKFKKHGDPLKGKSKVKDGDGCLRSDGYVIYQCENVKTLAHVLVATKALGKPLPKSAVVHHVDENPSNNDPQNLVICPNQAYHMLIHQRMRAMAACGDPNWLRCVICKQYDHPSRISVCGECKYHRECDAIKAKAYRARKRSKQVLMKDYA